MKGAIFGMKLNYLQREIDKNYRLNKEILCTFESRLQILNIKKYFEEKTKRTSRFI
jgi:hypothetical protein